MVCSILIGFWLHCELIGAIDYCDVSLCRVGRNHVACNVSEKEFGSNCPENVEQVNMTEEIKALILDLHNTRRSELASGKMKGFESAVRMPSVVGSNKNKLN